MSEGFETFTFAGVVDQTGHVQPDQPNVVRGRLAKLKGKKVNVAVKRYVQSKSNSQLQLFHGPLIEAWSEYTGYDPDEMKFWLKHEFGLWEPAVNPMTGEETKKLKSLADYTHEEMSTFVERCIREGCHLGIEFDRSSAGI